MFIPTMFREGALACEPPPRTIMLVESLKQAMLAAPTLSEKSATGLDAYNRAATFLLDVSCCIGSERLHESVSDAAEVLGLSAQETSVYETRAPLTNEEAAAAVQLIPDFILELGSETSTGP